MLPCGHTFCLKCIQKTNNRLCPLCKKNCSLPADGLQGLPKNFIVESFIASLPSVVQCAVAGDDSHGPVKFFCIDCWDPLCAKCGQGHNQCNRHTKNHVVKLMSEVDQSDIELHNRQKHIVCSQHKDKTIEFNCTNCELFICSTCYILSHNSHKCISVEDADAKLLVKLDDTQRELQESIKLTEAKIKMATISKNKLEGDTIRLLETLKALISDVKNKMETEYAKIVSKVDEYFNNDIKLIIEKTDEEKKELEQIVHETQMKLQRLQEKLSSFKRYSSPLSTAVERALLLNNDETTQLTSKIENTNDHPIYQLSDISQWKSDMDDWLKSFVKMLSNAEAIPRINSEDILIMAKLV